MPPSLLGGSSLHARICGILPQISLRLLTSWRFTRIIVLIDGCRHSDGGTAVRFMGHQIRASCWGGMPHLVVTTRLQDGASRRDTSPRGIRGLQAALWRFLTRLPRKFEAGPANVMCTEILWISPSRDRRLLGEARIEKRYAICSSKSPQTKGGDKAWRTTFSPWKA
jgi:hypothetical protein